MLAAPLLIAWLDHSTGALGTISRFFGFGGSGTGSPATFAGLVAAITAIAGYCRKALATVKPRAAGPGRLASRRGRQAGCLGARHATTRGWRAW